MSQLSVRNHLKDTAFCISLLYTGGQPQNFNNWYSFCQKLIEQFQHNLKSDGYTEIEIEQLGYAQCALLDEIALKHLSYPDRDEWEKKPLQVHFFQNHHAGETVCDRIEELVKEQHPNSALVEGYLSILGLGFQGRYVLDQMMYEQQKNRLKEQFNVILKDKKVHFQEPYPQESYNGKILWLDNSKTKKLLQLKWKIPAYLVCLLAIIVVISAYFILNYYLDIQIQQLKT